MHILSYDGILCSTLTHSLCESNSKVAKGDSKHKRNDEKRSAYIAIFGLIPRDGSSQLTWTHYL